MQTMSQLRAQTAMQLLLEIGECTKDNKDKKKEREEFAQLCKSFPTMILQNGLGQALAFILAKKQQHYTRLYEGLEQWLGENHRRMISGNLLRAIVEMQACQYVEVQREALKFLEWVKRFAVAEIFE
ncbi:MAG: type III-B CRISPR module-associated protein Cmr5 [Syntrophobacteria bacterium]